MAVVDKTTLKSYFETGDRPTESQFIDLIDSLMHTNDGVTIYGEYDDDAAAASGGVPVGGIYTLSQTNLYGIPVGNGGILKKRKI